MIIWLASYPRAGCDILRAILGATFGRRSFNREEPSRNLANAYERSPALRHLIAQRYPEGPWESFLEHARAAPDRVLVKTHGLPEDGSPFIHVVRDGRCALTSFHAYLATHHPESRWELQDLIAGKSVQGSWSAHVQTWDSRRAQGCLRVRYEELVAGGDALLTRLAAFLELPQPPRDWARVEAEIRAVDPTFFSRRLVRWERTSAWDDECEALFEALHGDVLRELVLAATGHPTAA